MKSAGITRGQLVMALIIGVFSGFYFWKPLILKNVKDVSNREILNIPNNVDNVTNKNKKHEQW